MKSILLKMMTNEVTIDLNVLDALLKNIIMGNVNRSTGSLRSTHVSQEPTKLEEFRGGIGESMVLSFSTRTSNNKLFLVTLRDRRGIQKEAVICGIATNSGILSPVYINIDAQLKGRLC